MSNVTAVMILNSNEKMFTSINSRILDVNMDDVEIINPNSNIGSVFKTTYKINIDNALVRSNVVEDCVGIEFTDRKYILFTNDKPIIKNIISIIADHDEVDTLTLVYKDLLKSYKTKDNNDGLVQDINKNSLLKDVENVTSSGKHTAPEEMLDKLNSRKTIKSEVMVSSYKSKKPCEVLLQPKPLNSKLIDEALSYDLLEELLELYPFDKYQDIYLTYFGIKKYNLENKTKLGKKIFKEEG